MHEFIGSTVLTHDSHLDRNALLSRINPFLYRILLGVNKKLNKLALKNCLLECDDSLSSNSSLYVYNLFVKHDIGLYFLLSSQTRIQNESDFSKPQNISDLTKGDSIDEKIDDILSTLSEVLDKSDQEIITLFMEIYDSLLLRIKSISEEMQSDLKAMELESLAIFPKFWQKVRSFFDVKKMNN